MTALLSGRRRARAQDDDQGAEQVGDGDGSEAAAEPRRSWARRVGLDGRGGVGGFTTSTSTRVFLVLIVAAIAAGPVALLLQMGRPEVAQVLSNTPEPTAAAAGPAARAASTATQFVRVWLSAGSNDRDQVVALVMVPPQTVQLPAARPAPPTWVEVADVEQTTPGEWRVLVQAGGGLAGSRATYLVLVRVGDAGAAAVSMPARVPAPVPPAPRAASLKTIRLSDPAAQAVSGFTTSLLTGDPEINRWVAPDSTLQSGPKACQAVTVTQVLSNTAEPTPIDTSELTVLATVDCTIAQASASRQLISQPLQYPLVLRARDGRWEVARYADAAPKVASPTTATPSAAGTAGTSPTSPPTGR